jgi:hypothetical protein
MRTKKHSAGKVLPHPVLGNGNDFPKDSFRTLVEISQESGSWKIDCEFLCDSEYMRKLVEDGKASFVADINCPSVPGSRRNFSSKSRKARFEISATEVAKTISVAAYVVANQKIKDYAPDGMHGDYGGRKFKVLKNELLAQDEEGTKFFDLDGGGDSFLKVRRNPDPKESIAKWEESSDHFWVVLPAEDFDNWMLIKKSDPEKESHIASVFVLPAVIGAIERIRDEDRSDLKGDGAPRWSKSLFGLLSTLKIDLDSCEPYEAAQKVLNCPISRVLANVLDIEEGEE